MPEVYVYAKEKSSVFARKAPRKDLAKEEPLKMKNAKSATRMAAHVVRMRFKGRFPEGLLAIKSSLVIISTGPVDILGTTGRAGPIAFFVIAVFPRLGIRCSPKGCSATDTVVFHDVLLSHFWFISECIHDPGDSFDVRQEEYLFHLLLLVWPQTDGTFRTCLQCSLYEEK